MGLRGDSSQNSTILLPDETSVPPMYIIAAAVLSLLFVIFCIILNVRCRTNNQETDYADDNDDSLKDINDDLDIDIVHPYHQQVPALLPHFNGHVNHTWMINDKSPDDQVRSTATLPAMTTTRCALLCEDLKLRSIN